MRSMVEGACGAEANGWSDAPSTAPRHSRCFASASLALRTAAKGRLRPLPRFAGQDEVCYTRIGIKT
jgi:hypothetical protein